MAGKQVEMLIKLRGTKVNCLTAINELMSNIQYDNLNVNVQIIKDDKNKTDIKTN